MYAHKRTEYEYLDTLRESGVTNMFGAVPYIEKNFHIEKKAARDILMDWMNNFPIDYEKGEFPDE
jgi:hypothetical protein